MALIWLFPAAAEGVELYRKGDLSMELAGHYANILSGSETMAEEPYYSDFQRMRLELQSQWGDDLSGLLTYDHRLLVSDALKTPDFKIAQNRQRKQFLDIDDQIAQDGNVRWDHLIYRGYLTYRSDVFDLRFGRQQVPWGVTYFWTPTDLFNPFDPLAIEKEERAGTDALDLKAYWDGLQYAELVYAPQREHRQDTIAGKLHLAVGSQEFSFILAESKESEVFGADYFRNIGESVLRMELTRTDAQDEQDFWKFSANMDHTFPNTFYILGEYHHNGQGRRDKNTYERLRRLLGEVNFLAQDFFGLKLGYDVNPLIRLENHFIWTLTDHSISMNPELRWSVNKNSEFLLGGLLFLGKQDTEYGQEHHVGYLRWKLFF